MKSAPHRRLWNPHGSPVARLSDLKCSSGKQAGVRHVKRRHRRRTRRRKLRVQRLPQQNDETETVLTAVRKHSKAVARSVCLRLFVGLVLCVVFAYAGTLSARAEPADLAYARAGIFVDVGGFRLNLRCNGSGKPTVVFDAGLSDWSPAWATVAPAIARRTRACSYDRAGNGFSDAGPMPRTSGRIVDELHRLLQRSGERPPFVLVGHSFGSFNVRLYADRYLRDVAGLVLVDGSHEDQGSLMDAADLRAAEKQFRACERAGVRSPASLRQLCDGLYFRGLPEKRFSPQLNSALERQALASKQAEATLSELQNFGTVSAAQVRAARRSFGDIPLRILTATNHRAPSGTKDDRYWRAWESRWRALHDSWLPLSTDATSVMAVGSGHYIQFDRTPLVIDAIDDVVARARRRR